MAVERFLRLLLASEQDLRARVVRQSGPAGCEEDSGHRREQVFRQWLIASEELLKTLVSLEAEYLPIKSTLAQPKPMVLQ